MGQNFQMPNTNFDKYSYTSNITGGVDAWKYTKSATSVDLTMKANTYYGVKTYYYQARLEKKEGGKWVWKQIQNGYFKYSVTKVFPLKQMTAGSYRMRVLSRTKSSGDWVYEHVTDPFVVER
ncbi:hypothetical protein [Terribacillus saccharophilus]|uniref:Uncharacterized protein n=1 Tax=Terribacillus saccharophilus TaxID=361277 RepID=A0ABX4GUL7_9BACI|nr:hypothetical protein [Terribacillus saccharophilus]PAD34224.1 hypothetical protein CHH56_15600 [Terribacillus saccharophilus]PAD94801.1 hypothetical protein CHH50_16690 [Terribacillus saccharophilus]PAD98550.1 hypothetical protein CHH48_16700 [Terribacillus saccharophilus]